ncbi:MAG: hypothetical protein DCC75_13015, partial [Proteobacteria bacterium]
MRNSESSALKKILTQRTQSCAEYKINLAELMSIPEQSPANRALQISLYNLMLALFFIVGLAMRWVYLDERPMHHDESLHAMFGKYFFDWPDHHF